MNMYRSIRAHKNNKPRWQCTSNNKNNSSQPVLNTHFSREKTTTHRFKYFWICEEAYVREIFHRTTKLIYSKRVSERARERKRISCNNNSNHNHNTAKSAKLNILFLRKCVRSCASSMLLLHIECVMSHSDVANLLMFTVNKKKVAFRPWFVIYDAFFVLVFV